MQQAKEKAVASGFQLLAVLGSRCSTTQQAASGITHIGRWKAITSQGSLPKARSLANLSNSSTSHLQMA